MIYSSIYLFHCHNLYSKGFSQHNYCWIEQIHKSISLVTYSNFLSNSKVGLPCPSTKSISAWAFLILEGFCNFTNKNAWAWSHTLIGQKGPSMKRSHGRPCIHITFSWNLQRCIQKLVTKNHTCASRKTAQVRTADVVSWPAISIVIRSSLSCQENIGRHDFEL